MNQLRTKIECLNSFSESIIAKHYMNTTSILISDFIKVCQVERKQGFKIKSGEKRRL